MATTSFSRTSGTPTNALKWTFSVWVKIGQPIDGDRWLLDFNTDSNNRSQIGWTYDYSKPQLIVYEKVSSSTSQLFTSAQAFEDSSAFYNIVVSCDRTLATQEDRTKIYINGERMTSFHTTPNYPAQNVTGIINTAVDTLIGKYSQSTVYYDGLMSYYCFVDGTAYDASYFGETESSSGIWKIKTSPSVTYGNNGFFLKMDTSSPGTDTSGNNNTFTPAGTPTLTQDNASNNFCTLNPNAPQGSDASNIVFTNGNTTWTSTTYSSFPTGTTLFGAGKWYYEVKLGGVNQKYGWAESNVGQGDPDYSMVVPSYWIYTAGNGNVSTANNATTNNASIRAGWTGWTTNDILGLALDIDNGKFYASLNGTWYNSGDPAAGTGAIVTGITQQSTGLWMPFLGSGDNSSITNYANFGNGFFGTTAVASSNADANGYGLMEYAVPTGFYTLCTKNINTYG